MNMKRWIDRSCLLRGVVDAARRVGAGGKGKAEDGR